MSAADDRRARSTKEEWTAFQAELARRRAERDELRLLVPAAFSALDEVLWSEDLVGLRRCGCPRDEYEAEVGTVLARLRPTHTAAEVRTVVQAEFDRWFHPRAIREPERLDSAVARIVVEVLPLLP